MENEDGSYTIKFSDQTEVTIRNGENGEDAPQITVIKNEEDGVYYWGITSTDGKKTFLKERDICGIGIHGNNHRYIFRSDRIFFLFFFLPYSLFPGIGLYFLSGSLSNPSSSRQCAGNRTLGDSQFFRYIIKSNFPVPPIIDKSRPDGRLVPAAAICPAAAAGLKITSVYFLLRESRNHYPTAPLIY